MHRIVPPTEVESPVTELDAAEAGVARANGAFSASLHDASRAGSITAERVVSFARPALIGAGVLAGGLIALRVIQSRRAPAVRPASEGSVWAELARSVAVSLALVAGRRLAERWLGQKAARAVRRLGSALAVVAALLAFGRLGG